MQVVGFAASNPPSAVAGLLAIAMSALCVACEAPDASSGDAGADGATAEERACAHLTELGCAPVSEEAGCVAALVQRRGELAAGCEAEYEAWVACVGAVTSCDAPSGVLCPMEYSLFGMCAL